MRILYRVQFFLIFLIFFSNNSNARFKKNIIAKQEPISLKEIKNKNIKRVRYAKNRKFVLQNKSMKDMSLKELKEQVDIYMQADNKKMALKYLEQAIKNSDNAMELKRLRLDLADLYFDLGRLEEAGKAYSMYSILYPGDDQLEYVSYKAVLCRFYEVLESDRDQTKTKDALELSEKFLEKSELFNKYSKEVMNIKNQCLDKLLESESKIFDFYLDKGNLKAAEVRLAGIKKYFEPKVQLADLEPRILYLEYQLAERQKKLESAAEKKNVLLDKYPDFHPFTVADSKRKRGRNKTILAQNSKKRKNVDRF